jgi:DNA repair protein RecO (recombination protein O)
LDKTYIYRADSGPFEGKASAGSIEVLGKTLINMADDNYEDPLTEKQSKQLMRYLINHYIGDKPLHSKQLFMAVQTRLCGITLRQQI